MPIEPPLASRTLHRVSMVSLLSRRAPIVSRTLLVTSHPRGVGAPASVRRRRSSSCNRFPNASRCPKGSSACKGSTGSRRRASASPMLLVMSDGTAADAWVLVHRAPRTLLAAALHRDDLPRWLHGRDAAAMPRRRCLLRDAERHVVHRRVSVRRAARVDGRNGGLRAALGRVALVLRVAPLSSSCTERRTRPIKFGHRSVPTARHRVPATSHR